MMMKCERCGCEDFIKLSPIVVAGSRAAVRVREAQCVDCGHTVTTKTESVEDGPKLDPREISWPLPDED